jgi:hypothetical protein
MILREYTEPSSILIFAMANDVEREAEALEWAEALIGDSTDATR